MPRQKSNIKRDKVIFFIMLTFTMLPIFILPLQSKFYHEIYNMPQIENGVLNLSDYDFQNNRDIPLNGTWEFYWKKWLVTDKLIGEQPDYMADVPHRWHTNRLKGGLHTNRGYASYRIRIVNCPKNINLTAYVPNHLSPYRIFFNGMQIAGSEEPSKTPSPQNTALLKRDQLGLPHAQSIELVIETSSYYTGGLYLAPLLAESSSNFMRSNLREALVGINAGILILAIVCYAIYLFTSSTRTFSFLALLAMNSLVLVRILIKDEFFGVFKNLAPFLQYYTTNALLQVVTLFFPLVLVLCAKNFLEVEVKKRVVVYIFIFELFCAIPVYYCFIQARMIAQSVLCIISLLPFVYFLITLYRNIKNGSRQALTVSVILMLLLDYLIFSAQTSSGLILPNISLLAPTCAALSVFLQGYMFVRQNTDMSNRALENTRLRLRLRENETVLMLSQIQPHFLYNALTAIGVLCSKEPEAASEAVFKFAKFLRVNMNAIGSHEPIPFSQELEHIKNYVSIEKMRFKDRLTVKYEIDTEDFSVPPLTIQPLMENAIKHGACKNVTGGTVTLKTQQTPGAYWITVTDDGPGFSQEALLEEEQFHGLKNITYRLQALLGAEVTMETAPGKGSNICVRIPKSEPPPMDAAQNREEEIV